MLNKEGAITKLSKGEKPLALKLHLPFAHETNQTLFTLSSATSLESSSIKSSPTGDLWIDTSVGFWRVDPANTPTACELKIPAAFVYSSDSQWQLANNGTQLLVVGPADRPSYALDLRGGCDLDLRGFPIDRSDTFDTLYGSKKRSEFFMKSGKFLTILNSKSPIPVSYSESSLDRLDVWQSQTDTLFVGRNFHGVFARSKSAETLWALHDSPSDVGVSGYEIIQSADRIALILRNGTIQLIDSQGHPRFESPSLTNDSKLVENNHFVLGSGWDEATAELFILTKTDWVRFHIDSDVITLLSREPHGLELFSPDIKKSKLRGQNVILLTDESNNRHLLDSSGKSVFGDMLLLLEQPYNYVINRTDKPLGREGWEMGEFRLFDEASLSPINVVGQNLSSFIKFNNDSTYLITGDAFGEMQFWTRNEQNKIEPQAFEKTWSWDDETFSDDNFTFDQKGRYLFARDKSKTKILDLKTKRLLNNTWDHPTKSENYLGFSWTDKDWGEVITTYNDGYRHFITDIDTLKRELCRFQSPQRRLNTAGFTPEITEAPTKLCD